jgi:outer membrane immunogenic protein
MKRVLLVGAALIVALAATQPALAADAPYWAPPPASAPFNWNGFYIGANGGYSWQDARPIELLTDTILPAPPPNNLGQATAASRGTIGDIRAQGWFAGGQVGYNWQYGSSVLFGIESDLQYSRIEGGKTGVFTNPNGTIPISGTASFNIDWFGTVRGRVGVMADSWLLFATGGLAYGRVGYNLSAIETGGGALYQTTLSASETKFGYVAGAGVEYAFAPNLILKGEYQYINLGAIGATAPVTTIAPGPPTGETATLKSIDAAFHTFRLGLNWKL